MEIHIDTDLIERNHKITLPRWMNGQVKLVIEERAVFIARGKRAALLSLSPQEARRIFH